MLALESELVATAVQDKIRAWLCAAKIQLSYVGNLDTTKMAKLLIAIGRYNEALSTLLKGCALFSSASLFLLLGVCFLRLDQTEEAEEAFVAANNQAVQAIEVYQAVIASDDGDAKDKMHKLDAAEKCAALLSSIGRDEELRTLRNIIVTLRE
eukprot:gene26478-33060_t